LPLTTAVDSDYFEKLDAVKAIREESRLFVSYSVFRFYSFDQVIKTLPKHCQQISNSSAIRYAQLIDRSYNRSVFVIERAVLMAVHQQRLERRK
jgi:hypothetical protein